MTEPHPNMGQIIAECGCSQPASCEALGFCAVDRAAQDDGAAFESFTRLICEAIIEADRARKKFPQPNYVISKVAEEAGEVVKAAIHCAEGRESMQALRGEMRQLIAMLYRLWLEGDGVHGLPPVGGTD